MIYIYVYHLYNDPLNLRYLFLYTIKVKIENHKEIKIFSLSRS